MQKKGGNNLHKIPPEMKENLIAKVDAQCTITLSQLASWLRQEHQLNVSISTIDRALRQFHYTLKKTTPVPERRNSLAIKCQRRQFSADLQTQLNESGENNIIFMDEVGFSIATRPSRGRSRSGTSAFVPVQRVRSRNITVVAAMTKQKLFFHKIYEKALNGEDFKRALIELKEACLDMELSNPILYMDNAPIHHYRGLAEQQATNEFFQMKYLPAYSPFLNPIENIFSIWKNLVIRSESKDEAELCSSISGKFEEITAEHCASSFRKILAYLNRCENSEDIYK